MYTRDSETTLNGALVQVIAQDPGALNGHGDIARELELDLRAMHGCLTTATLLIAPAVDDLNGQSEEVGTDGTPAGAAAAS